MCACTHVIISYGRPITIVHDLIQFVGYTSEKCARRCRMKKTHARVYTYSVLKTDYRIAVITKNFYIIIRVIIDSNITVYIMCVPMYICVYESCIKLSCCTQQNIRVIIFNSSFGINNSWVHRKKKIHVLNALWVVMVLKQSYVLSPVINFSGEDGVVSKRNSCSSKYRNPRK